MGHKNLIDGVGRDTTAGRCLVDGVGYSIKKGRTLEDGVGYDVAFGASGMAAGDLAVGSSVFANVNGVRTEFLVVHQGLPSSIYDASCDGTWLLMKDGYESRTWDASNSVYASSDVHTYLNETFLNLLATNAVNHIKQAKIPYRTAGSGGSTEQGANGLSTKIFLLSAPEVGFSSSNIASGEGARLDYFTESDTTALANKRIAYKDGTAISWWLRSPRTNATTHAWLVTKTGTSSTSYTTGKNYIRPAFILDSSAAISPDTFDILG